MSDATDVNDRIDDFARRARRVADENGWRILAGCTALGAALPLVGLQEGYYMTVVSELFMFAVLALSWDLIGGQTGYPSFGNMAFFGIGAYSTAILTKDMGVGFYPAWFVGAVLAVVAAVLIGAAVLRLRGGYFAIATLGVLLAAQQVTRNLDITGGASGKILLNSPSETTFYYLFLGLLAVEVALVYYLTGTRFGYVLNAIRDDEGKATAMGENTTYYKVVALAVAACFTGFAGGAWSLSNTFVDPATGYSLAWNVEIIAMSLLGGAGTVVGPVLGAFGLHGIVAVVDVWFSGWQLVIIGSIVIVTVIAFPKGVVGTLLARANAMEYYRHGGQAAGESPEEGAEE
jgi:branched-chain amino acid transport system permease protein